MAIKSSNQITFTEHKKIVEIKEYYLATSKNEGITTSTSGWTTDIQTIDYTNKYLWNYEEVIYSIGSSDVSEPVIIGFYGKGDTGKGISNIVNYYQITQNLVAPELPTGSNMHGWSDQASTASKLSPTNKYLWNYEAIIYTDGSTTTTDPAIIGVYGDSGADAITFEIYSVDGFLFKDGVEEIKLQVAAFKGSEAITGAKYTWSYLSEGSTSYTTISGYSQVATPTLTVKSSDIYALFSLKCTMYYNGETYQDYVILSREVEVYNAVVRFFDGNNVFSAAEPFVVAYVNLYKNNTLLETIPSNSYYISDDTSVSGTTITTSAPDGEANTYMYFIYPVSGKYRIMLGKYNGSAWQKVSVPTDYSYSSIVATGHQGERQSYDMGASNVVLIPKDNIIRSGEIVFTIKTKSGDVLTSTSATMVDLNDPVVSKSAPSNPVVGQMWVNTGVDPNILNVWNGSQWVKAEQQGGAVYTSAPSSYKKGDLWVLANAWNGFSAGTMLKANAASSSFNKNHWVDANSALTEMQANIKQYFKFDPNTGLRISQNDDKFYVNINATEMGFYDNRNGQHSKVVNISNNSATIQNAILKGSGGTTIQNNATFNGEVNIQGFIFKKESNNSLSLMIDT